LAEAKNQMGFRFLRELQATDARVRFAIAIGDPPEAWYRKKALQRFPMHG
jgi:hypothetical protein